MQRKDHSAIIALCLSLVVHAAIALALVLSRARWPTDRLRVRIAPWDASRVGAMTNDPPIAAQPPPARPDPNDPDNDFGERGATGKARESSPGEQPLLASRS